MRSGWRKVNEGIWILEYPLIASDTACNQGNQVNLMLNPNLTPVLSKLAVITPSVRVNVISGYVMHDSVFFWIDVVILDDQILRAADNGMNLGRM